MIPEQAVAEKAQQEKREKRKREIELYAIQQAVGRILEDYEQTAKTLDEVTQQTNGVDATDHASNVKTLKDELLGELQADPTTAPPWEKAGYETEQAWLYDR